MWITPLEAITSAVVTFESFIMTDPSFTSILIFLPAKVSAVLRLTTSLDVTFPETT